MIVLFGEESDVLKAVIDTGVVDDLAREWLGRGDFSRKEFKIFNKIRDKLGLEELKPFEEDEEEEEEEE